MHRSLVRGGLAALLPTADLVSVTEKAHELVVTAQPVTVEAADRLIEGIDQADLDTFVAVLAKLKENADNYSNNG